MFVKFQHREIMWGLVKLTDLEELVNTSLGGTPEATTLGPPKEEMLDLDVEDDIQEEENAEAQFSPDEAHIGML